MSGGARDSGFGIRGDRTAEPDSAAADGVTLRIPCPGSRTTTDPQDELFDVLDSNGEPIGVVKTRGDVHRDGDWHAALHIWVGGVGADGEAFALFQRRSLTKDTWAGYLDTTVGGHIRSGETLQETVREANEEIGLEVGLSDLTFIGRRFIAGSDGVVSEREVHMVFAVRCDQPLPAYRLHPEEVDALVAIPLDAAQRMFAGEVEAVDGIECGRNGRPLPARLPREQFIILDVEYQLAALPALAAVIDGDTPAPFELRTTVHRL